MQDNLIQELAAKLGLAEDEARKLIAQEVARKEAGVRYRKSDAYRKRLELQKLVRAELRKMEV